MMKAISGYYNGSQIVMDEQPALEVGQRVIITILDNALSDSDVRKKAEQMASAMGEFRDNIGDDIPWETEDEMIQDLAEFRRKRMNV